MEKQPEKTIAGAFLNFSRKMLIFRGILLVLLGILVFTNLPKVLQFLTMAAGILLLVDGVFNAAGIFADRKYSLISILGALVLIVFGVILLRHPLVFDTFLLMFIGAWIAFSGIQGIFFSFRTPNPLAALLLGILSVFVGATFLSTPWIGLIAYGWVIGTLLCVTGVITVATGFLLKAEKTN